MSAGDTVRITACVIREADYAPSAAVEARSQLLAADVRSGIPTYSVTGLREQELAQHVGRRVELAGTVEPVRTTPLLATVDGTRTGVINSETPPAAGVTPAGAAAHEPSDAVGSTVRAGRVTQPDTSTDPAYRVATLPRLNATSVRRVDGSCPAPAQAVAASASAPTAPTGPRLPLSRESAEAVTARGCLVRKTAGGTALTPNDSRDPLLLTSAALATGQAVGSQNAVPGSAPSGAGSGTVPEARGTTGSGPAPVDANTLTFALALPSGELADLRRNVGQRVEIVGTLQQEEKSADAAGASATGRVQPAPDAAHPSAPGRVITVTSFRPLGGGCN